MNTYTNTQQHSVAISTVAKFSGIEYESVAEEFAKRIKN